MVCLFSSRRKELVLLNLLTRLASSLLAEMKRFWKAVVGCNCFSPQARIRRAKIRSVMAGAIERGDTLGYLRALDQYRRYS